jgi:hypothetical protein
MTKSEVLGRMEDIGIIPVFAWPRQMMLASPQKPCTMPESPSLKSP